MNISHIRGLIINPVYLACLFVFSGLGLFFFLKQLIPNAYTTLYPLSLFLASVISIVALYFLPQGLSRIPILTTRKEMWKWLIVSYLGCSSILLYSYHYYGYERGVAVYISTLFIYIITVLSIIYLENWKLSLGFVICTAVLHRATIYFTSPVAFGTDPHDHYNWAIEVAAAGNLDPLTTSKYFFAPFYHLLGATGSLLFNMRVQDGVMFLMMIIPIVIVTSLVIFSLLTQYWGKKIGLLGSLLFLSSGHAIGNLLSLGTTELAMLFFALIIYVVIIYLRSGEKRLMSLLFLLLIFITLVHQASTFITVIIVSTFLILTGFFAQDRRRVINIVLILGMTLMFDWFSTKSGGPEGDVDFFTQLLGNALASFLRTGGTVENRPEFSLPPDSGLTPTGQFASMTEIHVLGGSLLFGFGIIGILWWLHEVDNRSFRLLAFTLGGATGALFALMMAGPLIGFSYFVPGRWFMYLYFVLSIFAAVGLVVTVRLFSFKLPSANVAAIILLCLLMIGMVGVMGGNAYGSIDDPIFDSAPGAERLSFSESENSLVVHAQTYSPESAEVHTDFRYSIPFRYYHETTIPSQRIRVHYGTGELGWTSENHVTYLAIRPQMTEKSIYQIRYNDRWYSVYGPMPFSEEHIQQYNLVYQNEGDCDGVNCGLHHQPE